MRRSAQTQGAGTSLACLRPCINEPPDSFGVELSQRKRWALARSHAPLRFLTSGTPLLDWPQRTLAPPLRPAMIVTAALATALTVIVSLAPDALAYHAPQGHVAVETAAALVSLLVAFILA